MSKRGETPAQFRFNFDGKRRVIAPMIRRSDPNIVEDNKPEHILGASAVKEYFRIHHYSIKFEWTGLEEHAYLPPLWHMEEVLVQDLEKAKHGADPEAAHHLRKLIYAVSWRSHNRPDLGELITHLTSVGFTLHTGVAHNMQAHLERGNAAAKMELRAWRAHLTPSGVSAASAEKIDEEIDANLKIIERVIEGNIVGDDVTESISLIEQYIDSAWHAVLSAKGKRTWEELESKELKEPIRLSDRARGETPLQQHFQLLESLREIRDFLIHNKYYETWAKLRRS